MIFEKNGSGVIDKLILGSGLAHEGSLFSQLEDLIKHRDLAFSDDGFDAPARTEATQAKKAVQSHNGRASGGTEKETGINPVSFSEGWWADVLLSRHRGT